MTIINSPTSSGCDSASVEAGTAKSKIKHRTLSEQLRKLHELNALLESESIATNEELVVAFRDEQGGLRPLLHSDEGLGLDSEISEAVLKYIDSRKTQIVTLLEQLGISVDESLVSGVRKD